MRRSQRASYCVVTMTNAIEVSQLTERNNQLSEVFVSLMCEFALQFVHFQGNVTGEYYPFVNSGIQSEKEKLLRSCCGG